MAEYFCQYKNIKLYKLSYAYEKLMLFSVVAFIIKGKINKN